MNKKEVNRDRDHIKEPTEILERKITVSYMNNDIGSFKQKKKTLANSKTSLLKLSIQREKRIKNE
jgi:hypothetical protein